MNEDSENKRVLVVSETEETFEIHLKSCTQSFTIRVAGKFGIFYVPSGQSYFIPPILNAICSRKPKLNPGMMGYAKTQIKWQIFPSSDKTTLRVVFEIVSE